MKRFFYRILVLMLMIISVYSIDAFVARWYGEQTLAPVLAMLCFGILILLRSPGLILFSIPLLASESFWIIQDVSKYPFIRTVSVTLGGVFAFWICRQRKLVEGHLAELDLILKKLQAPWVLCDRSGNIRRLSLAAAELSGAKPAELEGISFFTRFSAGLSKGELIQKFLQAADFRAPVEKLILSTPDNPERLLTTSFVPVQTREGANILVILAPLPG